MTTAAENELMTRIDGGAPMGQLMSENYWIPFAMSSHLVHGEAPLPVRLFGEDYVAFRGEGGEIGFLDEHCPHRRASLLLGRVEGDCLRCIYHGWAIDTSGTVVDVPTQTIRPEVFARNVPVVHFPVRESGGLAWVWLGEAEEPDFPELPFGDEDLHRYWCVSRVPCNWLQGVEGTIDSVHAGMLHRSWIELSLGIEEHAGLGMAINQPPTYAVRSTDYGIEAAALRPTGEDQTYVRISQHFMPFVTILPVGSSSPRTGSVFVVTPVDDTHHLLFFGTFGETPHSAVTLDEIFMQAPDYDPDPLDYAGLRGDRLNTWGQDRSLMAEGHFSGVGRSLLEEDAIVQTSMGAIVDRSKETLSSSDVAVAQNRRQLLDALEAASSGALPPGSAVSGQPVVVPNCNEMLLGKDQRWDDLATEPVAG